MVLEREPRPGPRSSLIEESLRLREREATSEVLLVPSFDVSTITGLPGNGKTEVAELFEIMLLELDTAKIGKDLRVKLKKETGEHQGAYFKVPVEKDIITDAWQLNRMRNARKPQPGPRTDDELRWRPINIEGRISGPFGAKVFDEIKGANAPRIFRVLLTYDPGGDQTGRYLRLFKRERKKRPDITLDQVIEDTERRESEFVEKIHLLEQRAEAEEEYSMYRDLLRGGDPYDPKLKTKHETTVYNLVIDTKDRTIPEVAAVLMRNLLKHNLLRPLRREDFGQGILGDSAYEAVSEASPCIADVLTEGNCGRYATRTLDSYRTIKGTTSVKLNLACSSKHAKLIRNALEQEALESGVRYVFRKNGKPIAD